MAQRRLYFDALSAIGIGFLVTLLGTIIPNLIIESRDNFERAKQSRIAYNQAKTSVIYLPGTLAVLEYGEAMAVLQESHRKLHIAETYGKELDKYLKWYGDKMIWTDQTYWELTAVRTLLQSRANEWNGQSVGARTGMIDEVLSAVRKLFGNKGEKWRNLPEKDRETQMAQVMAKIRSTAPRRGPAA
ncbi:MAG TPA: hypothetical protein PKK23_15390 [Nitrospirales bacterium]|nr:hypothetical protein [Nitrospirales bacterium]